MIQYIYFVKCPNCEDEHFDFFDEAKAFALGCLSQKPIITQIEVDRNDFGECTDSNDLGMVWSWEDECKECGPDAEKAGSHILTKADLANVPGCDPEFDALDNSVEVEDGDEEFREGVIGRLGSEADEINLIEFTELCKEIGIETVSDLDRFIKDESNRPGTLLDKLKSYRAELGADFKIKESRKPVPEGMTIEQLVEEMEENEDIVECTWCNELFPKDECRKEVDLGYLCSRCEAAIKSRGEDLTFRENNYWDFFNEDFSDPVDFEDEESEEETEEESIFDNAESVEEVVDILVKDEEEAIAAYEEAADKIEELASEEDIEETKEVLDHIKEEEEEHIEELEGLLPEETEEDENETSEISVEEAFKPLSLCPECGAEKAFDHEAGVCNNCGFII